MEGDIEEMNIIKNNLEQTSGRGGISPQPTRQEIYTEKEATNVVSFVKGGVKLKFELTRDYL